MKRGIAIVLSMLLAFSLWGCNSDNPGGEHSTKYSTTDVLVSQASALTRQMGICAQGPYLKAMQIPQVVIAEAGVFRQSIEGQPTDCRIIATQNKDFGAIIAQYTGTLCGSEKLACIGALCFSTTLQLPEKQEATTVVYLRYSDLCHYAVVFVPVGGKLVSATVYPVYTAVAQKLLEDYFTDTVLLSGDALRQAIARGNQASVKASPSGESIDAEHYIDLVSKAFSGMKPVSKAQVEEYTNDERVVSSVCQISKLLGQEPAHAAAYYFPAMLEGSLNKFVDETENGEAVEELTRQRLYLSYANTHSNRFGMEHVATNAALVKLCRPANLGAVARRDERPVLVVLNFADQYTVLVVVYPGANQCYEMSFAYLPVGFEDISDILQASGAEEFH